MNDSFTPTIMCSHVGILKLFALSPSEIDIFFWSLLTFLSFLWYVKFFNCEVKRWWLCTKRSNKNTTKSHFLNFVCILKCSMIFFLLRFWLLLIILLFDSLLHIIRNFPYLSRYRINYVVIVVELGHLVSFESNWNFNRTFFRALLCVFVWVDSGCISYACIL